MWAQRHGNSSSESLGSTWLPPPLLMWCIYHGVPRPPLAAHSGVGGPQAVGRGPPLRGLPALGAQAARRRR